MTGRGAGARQRHARGQENGYTFLGLAGRVVVFPKGRDSVGVRGNVVEAYGQAPAVLIVTDAPCIFTDNRCFLGGAKGFRSVRLAAGAAIASNNYLQGPLSRSGLTSSSAGGPFTVLGNISRSDRSNGAACRHRGSRSTSSSPWPPLDIN